MMETEKKRSDFEEILAVILIFISVFFAFTYFLTVALGTTIFFFTPDGAAASVRHMNGLLFFIGVRSFFYIPVTPSVGEVFFSLTGVFFLCLLAAWKYRENFHTVLRKGSSQPIGHFFNNFLSAMPIISSMLLTAVLAIISLQSSAGLPTEPPPSSDPFFIDFFKFSYAAVIEEIGFRIIPIGFFLVIYVFEFQAINGIALSVKEKLKLVFTAFLVPDRAKKAVGIKTVSDSGIKGGISRSEWIMIFITAFGWGLAHFLVGGWTVGKITSVFINGLVFGLTYIAYGAYAPILLHWFFNYYLSVLGYDFSFKYSPYLMPIGSLAVLLMLAIGIAGWIAFAIIGVKKLLKLKTKSEPPLPQLNH